MNAFLGSGDRLGGYLLVAEMTPRLAAGAHWIDIAPLSRARGGAAAMLVDDGLHPSAAMYALWAGLALPAARDALRHGQDLPG